MTSRRSRLLPALLTLPILLLAACTSPGQDSPGQDSPGQASAADQAENRDGCVSDYTEGTDYFPVKSTVSHAQNFTISYHDSYQVVEVKQSYQGGPAEKYVLYRCGTPAPEATGELAGAQQIEIPVRSVFTASTTQLPMLDELDRLDTLTGVATTSLISNETARQRAADGDAVEFAPGGVIDTEQVISAAPDVLMTSGFDDSAHGVLRENGVPVVAYTEWLEPTPLGRAEWLKYVAAFTGDEEKAGTRFTRIETDYRKVAAVAAGTGRPTTVLPGQMFDGAWYMPAGGSYGAALLKDANATYAWADTPGTGSTQLSLEEVLGKAREAEIWVMSTDVKSLTQVAADDPRYTEFAAFRSGQVWSTNAKVTPDGGVDYFETGVARPDLVLADLVTVLHPDAGLDHKLVFHRRLDP